ncbi:protein rep [Levilactobacillus brevis]
MTKFKTLVQSSMNEHDGSYNQHLHVLLFVRSSYFKSSDSYINQEEWTRLWQKALKVEYFFVAPLHESVLRASLVLVYYVPLRSFLA